MSAAVCAHCGCSDIDIDHARGDAVCTSCGSVLDDQIIVSEVQFQENSSGVSSVIGQYVSAEGTGMKHCKTPGGYPHGFGRESRAITLQKGKKRIQQLGVQVKLNQHCIDTAYNFFKMAVNRRLTRGRKALYVAAACLYIVCRTEGTPHMLLDFSDVLQVNVYNLGKTYLQLSKELCINVPALDPCLYLHRFAHKLEFGEKTHEVSMTALRLVSRMKRDWIHIGRRPSGLCGAALLVAARIHGFNRLLKDLITVVKVTESTLRKRLIEFEHTPSSQLTIDEFQRIDLEEETDPPCFSEGKRKGKKSQHELLEDNEKLQLLTEEVFTVKEKLERALSEEESKKKKHRELAKKCSNDSDVDEELSLCSEFIQDDYLQDVLTGKDLSENNTEDSDDDRDPTIKELEKEVLESILRTPSSKVNNTESSAASESTTEYASMVHMRPTAASLGLTESIKECMNPALDADEKGPEEESGELDLEGISDSELENFILSDDEVKIKTRIWTMANADYLKEEKEKLEKAALEAEQNKNEPRKKKKHKKKIPIQANSAGEAIEKMLQERKISSKINYDVLKDLNKINSTKTKPQEESPEPLLQDGTTYEASPVKLPSTSRFKRSHLAVDSKQQTTQLSKRARISESVLRIEPSQPKNAEEVVVETGPVEYAPEGDLDGEEAEEDYEDEYNISAARLMGHTGAEEEDLYDVDEVY